MSEKEIDCFGEMCPVPIIRIKKQLETLKNGDTIKVVSDHNCVVQSILSNFENKKITIEYEEVMNGVWEIFITPYE